jgi:Leucine-rich repeat (LRR) protein
LKELSLEIIDAYKSKDWTKIQLYADSVFGDSGLGELEGSKVFLKLIKYFHPDRINFLVKDIENSYEKNNLERLIFYKNLLSTDTLVTKAYNERFDLDIAETYHYSEEDFHDFMPSIFDDFDEDELREVEEYNNFLTAMKCEYIGMHNLRILDLSYNSIEDVSPLLHLEGLQFINLEKNPLRNPRLTKELEARSVVVIQ